MSDNRVPSDPDPEAATASLSEPNVSPPSRRPGWWPRWLRGMMLGRIFCGWAALLCLVIRIEAVEDESKPYTEISGFYGPGAVGAWVILIMSVLARACLQRWGPGPTLQDATVSSFGAMEPDMLGVLLFFVFAHIHWIASMAWSRTIYAQSGHLAARANIALIANFFATAFLAVEEDMDRDNIDEASRSLTEYQMFTAVALPAMLIDFAQVAVGDLWLILVALLALPMAQLAVMVAVMARPWEHLPVRVVMVVLFRCTGAVALIILHFLGVPNIKSGIDILDPEPHFRVLPGPPFPRTPHSLLELDQGTALATGTLVAIYQLLPKVWPWAKIRRRRAMKRDDDDPPRSPGAVPYGPSLEERWIELESRIPASQTPNAATHSPVAGPSMIRPRSSSV